MLEIDFDNVQDQEHPMHGAHLNFLYGLLKERLEEPDTNISHKEMPTWEQHIEFVNGQNYVDHYVIRARDDALTMIGSIYLTYGNEIGIHIAKGYRRQGYGERIIRLFLENYEGEVFANINPNNDASIALFKKFGFKHIQNTYKLELVSPNYDDGWVAF